MVEKSKNLNLSQQNKCLFIIIIFFISCNSLYAGKKLYSIGNYTNVEVLNVTADGILISHSWGISRITDEKLSDEDKNSLASEIKQYHKLRKIQKTNIEKKTKKTKKIQTEELKNLMTKIPQMSLKELQNWSKKRIGAYLSDKNFSTRFNHVFFFAENKDLFLTVIYDEYFKKLSKELCNMSPERIDMECERLFEAKYSDKNFRRILKQRYHFVGVLNTFFTKIDRSIANYRQQENERRRKENIRKQQENERRRKEQNQLAQITYRNLLSNFVTTVNHANHDENLMKNLVQLGKQAAFIKNNLKLTVAQVNFLDKIIGASVHANLYFKFVKTGIEASRKGLIEMSEARFAEADNEAKKARQYIFEAKHIYNYL